MQCLAIAHHSQSSLLVFRKTNKDIAEGTAHFGWCRLWIIGTFFFFFFQRKSFFMVSVVVLLIVEVKGLIKQQIRAF